MVSREVVDRPDGAVSGRAANRLDAAADRPDRPLSRRRAYFAGLLAVCIATRLATTIYYIEDTDSLRFALSVADEFDVAALQPHFPGYPVFWAAAKVLFLITGSFAVSFSLIGGMATFAVAWFAVRLSGRDPLSADGLAIAFLVVFNPMIWLMGNRYMPDLMGLAVALAALFALTREDRQVAGGLATGLLAGTRLSYLPLLLPAYVLALRRRPLHLIAASVAAAAVWLVPMIIDTGWSDLVAAASQQTEGHFTEFGGTVETNPNVADRAVRMFESIWADGLGAWWPARHWLTALIAAALITSLAAVLATAWHHVRPRGPSPVPRPPTPARATRNRHLLAAGVVYTTWIFLFQNVIHKSRHVLPLVALLCIPLGLALARGLRARAVWPRLVAAAGALAYAAVTLVLVTQHRSPSAIAQAKQLVDEARPDAVASIPLVNYYLSAQGVDAEFLSVQDQADRERLAAVDGKLIVIGRYPGLMPPNPARADTFYHNPYVNRMWPEVEVYVYDR